MHTDINSVKAKKDKAYQLLDRKPKDIEGALKLFKEVCADFKKVKKTDIGAEIGAAECYLFKKEPENIVWQLKNIEPALNIIANAESRRVFKYKVYKLLLIAYLDIHAKSNVINSNALKQARKYFDLMLLNAPSSASIKDVGIILPNKNIMLDERAYILYLRLLIWEKDYRTAKVFSDHALAKHPKNFEVIFEHGKILFGLGKKEDMVNLLCGFYDIIAKDNSPEALSQKLQIAYYFFSQSKVALQKARQIVMAVLEIESNNGRAKKLLNEIDRHQDYESKPDLNKIAKDLVSAEAQDAQNVALLTAQKLAKNPTTREQAFCILELIIQYRPQAEKAYFALIQMCREDNKSDRAINLSKDYLQRFTDSPQNCQLYVISILGNFAAELRDIDLMSLAKKFGQLLIEKYPDNMDAKYGYLRLLDLELEFSDQPIIIQEQIETGYKEILTNDANFWYARASLARFYSDQDENEKVIELCKYIDKYEGNIGKGGATPSAHHAAVIYNQLAIVYKRELNFGEAEKYVLKGINLVAAKIRQKEVQDRLSASERENLKQNRPLEFISDEDPILHFSGVYSTAGHLYYEIGRTKGANPNHSLFKKSHDYHEIARKIDQNKFVEKHPTLLEKAGGMLMVNQSGVTDDKSADIETASVISRASVSKPSDVNTGVLVQPDKPQLKPIVDDSKVSIPELDYFQVGTDLQNFVNKHRKLTISKEAKTIYDEKCAQASNLFDEGDTVEAAKKLQSAFNIYKGAINEAKALAQQPEKLKQDKQEEKQPAIKQIPETQPLKREHTIRKKKKDKSQDSLRKTKTAYSSKCLFWSSIAVATAVVVPIGTAYLLNSLSK